MRDPKRIDPLLGVIRSIWKKEPDLRLCQLIGNCFGPMDLYHVEDDRLVQALREYYRYQDDQPKKRSRKVKHG